MTDQSKPAYSAGAAEAMSDKKPDGGPAFPVLLDDYRDAVKHPMPGMTLRDWFAGQALAGIASDPTIQPPAGNTIGGLCYRIADAMLAEREK